MGSGIFTRDLTSLVSKFCSYGNALLPIIESRGGDMDIKCKTFPNFIYVIILKIKFKKKFRGRKALSGLGH